MKRLSAVSAGLVLAVLLLPVTAVAQTPPECESDYTVQIDDWLSKIADKYFGNMFDYDLIVEATNAKAAEDASFRVIFNPNLIYPGENLWIPDR